VKHDSEVELTCCSHWCGHLDVSYAASSLYWCHKADWLHSLV